jgi:hypothetical protein
MSQLRYVPGNTPAEREPQLWDTIRGLEAKLVIAEYEAREKISARQDVRESLLHRAVRIAENAIDAHSCGCSRCKDDLQNLNNLKHELHL